MHPLTIRRSTPLPLRSAISRIVSIDSVFAASMKPHVLTMTTSASSRSFVIVIPESACNCLNMISASTRFLGQPREIMPTRFMEGCRTTREASPFRDPPEGGRPRPPRGGSRAFARQGARGRPPLPAGLLQRPFEQSEDPLVLIQPARRLDEAVIFLRVNRHVPVVLLQLDQFLHEADGVLEVHVRIDHAVADEQISFQSIGEVDRRRPRVS